MFRREERVSSGGSFIFRFRCLVTFFDRPPPISSSSSSWRMWEEPGGLWNHAETSQDAQPFYKPTKNYELFWN